MIARILTSFCLIAIQGVVAGDQRSNLILAAPHRLEGRPAWFVIAAAPKKRVLVALKDAKIVSLNISAEFPYSVSLTESPTSRYSAVLLFEDRSKDIVIDSFGITASDGLERTDPDTHQKLIDCAAEGRALGEKFSEQIWGEHH
jgi:hypothetical protein